MQDADIDRIRRNARKRAVGAALGRIIVGLMKLAVDAPKKQPRLITPRPLHGAAHAWRDRQNFGRKEYQR